MVQVTLSETLRLFSSVAFTQQDKGSQWVDAGQRLAPSGDMFFLGCLDFAAGGWHTPHC
jgi:hypothetical protein